MNRSLLLVVCDFLLLSILALARFDVPEGATIAQDGQKVVSKEVIERISDGESYDDVVAELEATNETLLENLSSDKDDLEKQKQDLEEQILLRQKELESKEQAIASRDEVIAGNQVAIAEAKK
jgi:microcompartment protein CcmL/EutN